MARAYLQGQWQERELEPESACLDGPHQNHHRYLHHQKQSHQYHRLHVPPPPDDDAQLGPHTPGLIGGRSTKERGSWRGRGSRRSSHERGGGGRGRAGRGNPGDLLENEVVSDLQEGGEGPLTGDPCSQVVIGGVETPQDIEHQDPVGHRALEVLQSISHALHPSAELTNGEVPLLEGAEGGVELESAELGVAEELHL